MTAQLSGVGSAGHRTHAELRSQIQSGTMGKTKRQAAANMLQKGEMKKTTTNSRLRHFAAVWENEGERKNGLMEIARIGH